MKIVIIGSNGQLGSDIYSECLKEHHECIGLTHTDIEISEFNSVHSVLKRHRPEVIINTAAMHNVEICEQYPDKAYDVNAQGAKNLAVVCDDINATLVHISTDYVFGNEHQNSQIPYIESDSPNPLNVYGQSKLKGERLIQNFHPRHFILRTSGLYGIHPCRSKTSPNFIELMLKLGTERPEVRVVNDEFLTPTSTLQLAQQLNTLIKTNHYGLYHATCEGMCSWHEFAKTIFRMAKLPAQLQVAGPNEFPIKTPRPKFSVMENLELKKSGMNIFSHWEDSLMHYLKQRGQNHA